MTSTTEFEPEEVVISLVLDVRPWWILPKVVITVLAAEALAMSWTLGFFLMDR